MANQLFAVNMNHSDFVNIRSMLLSTLNMSVKPGREDFKTKVIQELDDSYKACTPKPSARRAGFIRNRPASWQTPRADYRNRQQEDDETSSITSSIFESPSKSWRARWGVGNRTGWTRNMSQYGTDTEDDDARSVASSSATHFTFDSDVLEQLNSRFSTNTTSGSVSNSPGKSTGAYSSTSTTSRGRDSAEPKLYRPPKRSFSM